MNKRLISPVFALLLAFSLPATGVAASTPPDAVPAAPETPKPKNLTREETKRLRDAREKAEADPAVKEAKSAYDAAAKARAAAKKSADKEALANAGKACDAAHDAFVRVRRETIAKTDPEAAKLDERAFAAGERLKQARGAKAAKGAEPAKPE